MNNAQKRVIIFGLCALSVLLILVFWAFGTGYEYSHSILVWNLRPSYTMNQAYGLRLRMGATGVICGLILPVILLIAAAFIHKSDKR